MTRDEFEQLPDEKLVEICYAEVQGLTEDYYGPPPILGPSWSVTLIMELCRRLLAKTVTATRSSIVGCPNPRH